MRKEFYNSYNELLSLLNIANGYVYTVRLAATCTIGYPCLIDRLNKNAQCKQGYCLARFKSDTQKKANVSSKVCTYFYFEYIQKYIFERFTRVSTDCRLDSTRVVSACGVASHRCEVGDVKALGESLNSSGTTEAMISTLSVSGVYR